jgi:hypothetical protein
MPELFESNAFDPATTAIMRSALEVALLKCRPSRADEERAQRVLASAIVDLVNDGEWKLGDIVDKALSAYSRARNDSRFA